MTRTFFSAAALMLGGLTLAPCMAEESAVESSQSSVSLAVGETRTIELPSNPSTGYNWVDATENKSCAEVSLEFVAPKTPRGLCGAPGVCRVSIRGISPGTQKLKLLYVRPWEPRTPDDETKEFTVTVTE